MHLAMHTPAASDYAATLVVTGGVVGFFALLRLLRWRRQRIR